MCHLLYQSSKHLSNILDRALVRAGGTGGMPPVNFSQRVAATRQFSGNRCSAPTNIYIFQKLKKNDQTFFINFNFISSFKKPNNANWKQSCLFTQKLVHFLTIRPIELQRRAEICFDWSFKLIIWLEFQKLLLTCAVYYSC